MSDNQWTRFADVGQIWVPWDPETAFGDERLARAVSEFEPVPNPAGWAAARWLREDSLASYGVTVTYLVLVGMRVEGFYAMCAGEVELPTKQRRDLGLSHPRQGVALIVWLARCEGSRLSGQEILAHAFMRAKYVARIQGLAGIAVDPFDAETAAVWRAEPYEFLKSQTKLPNDLKRLWRPLSNPVMIPAPAAAPEQQLEDETT